MFNIASYLEKFKNFGQAEKQVKENIKKSVKEILHFDLETKNITIKNGEVSFQVSPAIKNAIFIKKEQILKR